MSRRSSASVAATLCLLTVCSVVPAAFAQLNSVNITDNTLVLTSQGFAAALTDAGSSVILLDSTVTLRQQDFQPTLLLSHNVTVASSNSNSSAMSTLDFDHGVDMILVSSGASLTFEGLQLANIASADKGDAGGENVVQALALWPSVSGEPGASFTFENSSAQYVVPVSYNNCSTYQQRVRQQEAQLLGAAFVSMPNADTVSVSGRHATQLPVTSNQLTIGSVSFVSEDSSSVCVEDSSGGGGKHFPWWAGLILGLGIALILAVVSCMAAAAFVLRLKRRAAALEHRIGDMESQKGDTDGVRSGRTTPATAGAEDSPREPVGWTPPGSRHSAGSGGGTGASDALQPLLRTHTASGLRSGSTGDITEVHSHLLAMRLQSGLEGVEVGPQIGRGSYGCVYKGRWRGALVAIKIVEAPLTPEAGASEDATRESLLSASIAHPNVVACYKICSVRTPVMDSERSSGAGDTDAAANANSQALTEADIAAASASPGVQTAAPPPAPSPTAQATESVRTGSDPGVMQRTPSAGKRLSSSRRDSGASEARTTPTTSAEGMTLEVLGSQSEGGASGKGVVETWMLLEYADRGSLEQAIQARRFYKRSDASLDLANIYRTLLDIAAGVYYLHGLKIVHGDLKPANVLLKSTATDARGFLCKLADFGLSRMVAEHRTHVSAATMGTVPYMPPEHLSSQRLSKAVDIYSIGIMMHQLYTGRQPYRGMSMPSVIFNVMHQNMRPDVPADMPTDYKDLMVRCWDANPSMRPTDEELVAALAAQAKALAARLAEAPKPPLPAPAPTARKPSFSLRDLLPKKRSSSSDSEGGGGGSGGGPPVGGGHRPKRSGNVRQSSSNSTGSNSGGRGSSARSTSPELEDSASATAAAAAAAAAAGAVAPATLAPNSVAATRNDSAEVLSSSSVDDSAGDSVYTTARGQPPDSKEAGRVSSAAAADASGGQLQSPFQAARARLPEGRGAAKLALGADGRESSAASDGSISLAGSVGSNAGSAPAPQGPPPAGGNLQTARLADIDEVASRASDTDSGRLGTCRRASSAPLSPHEEQPGQAPSAAESGNFSFKSMAPAEAGASTSEVWMQQGYEQGQRQARQQERFTALTTQSRTEGGTIRYSIEGRRFGVRRSSLGERPRGTRTSMDRQGRSSGQQAPSANERAGGRAAAGSAPDVPLAAATSGELTAGLRSPPTQQAPAEAAAAGLIIPVADDSLGAAADAAVQQLEVEEELAKAASAALRTIE